MKKFLSPVLLGAALTCAAAPHDVTADHEFLVGTSMHFTYNEGILDEALSVMKQGGHNTWRGDALTEHSLAPDGRWLGIGSRTLTAAKASHQLGILAFPVYNNTCEAMNFDFPVGQNLPPYVNFCCHAADGFQGLTSYCQIWNEWDGACGMIGKYGFKMKHNTPENYAAMLKAVYPKLKKAHPDLIVTATSNTSTRQWFLLRLFELGCLDYCDAYTVNYYNHFATPEQVYQHFLEEAAMSARYNHGVPKPFYITETSWITYFQTVSEATQGDYCARLYLLMKSVPSCRGVLWYNFNERGDDASLPSHFFGMVMRDMTPKDAYYALASVSEVVKKGIFVKRLPCNDPNVWLMLYQMPDKTFTLAAWTQKTDVRARIILKKGKTVPGPLVLERAGTRPVRRRWGYRDQSFSPRYNHKRYMLPENPELFSFHTTTRPMLLSGLPADFTVDSVTEIAMPQRKTVIGSSMLKKKPATGNKPVTMLLPSKLLQISRTPTTITLDPEALYRAIPGMPPRAGSKDFSCTLTAFYNDAELRLTFDVTDNVHHVSFDNLKLWEGDSLQLGFCPVTPGVPVTDLRPRLFNVASDTGYSVCLTTPDANGQWTSTREFVIDISRPAPGQVRYDLKIRYPSLGVTLEELRSGRKFLAFSFLVNDNDGAGRKGFFRWGSGLDSDGADPTRFGALVFQ